MNLELTEERVIPKKMHPENGLLIEHIARYKFASKYAQGRVLDFACGVGYGAEVLLAMGEGIKEIVGVDIDARSIEYARVTYDYPQTNFFVGEATDEQVIQNLGKFDTIISIETVEHIKDDYQFVHNLKKLLKVDGTLVISTPFGEGRDEECSNPYHYRQYTEEEFRDLLSSFTEVEIFCQRDDIIEKPKADEKYYLMVAVCEE
ncbi:class I SAM-dependent methyltransferase [Halanaerobacter jeridensis]|uniref:2-polyprenyl-3-methyl-5-hydroxy-6-metoxy-1, 4-benzoquinol methylase n=1 Tax=Halanaerobacter jeridensis TaxID=706427 RepID=A0A938XPL3_9FIRM|nr:methyltransferase domain-containing protein [Halanaerobacter jeridensis]MBM7557158.1 2-polyprenyl-3-methyl-5-hydroxy-6-metoxy-1,4-benzoquinol methylase [Halanaerobacter jeridensis]